MQITFNVAMAKYSNAFIPCEDADGNNFSLLCGTLLDKFPKIAEIPARTKIMGCIQYINDGGF